MHKFAQLAPESTYIQLHAVCINITRVLYVDDYNYQYTNAVICLCILTLPIIYRLICGI